MTLNQLTAADAAHAIASGETSSEELTRACIAHIEAVQPTLNCFISFDPDGALAAARQADASRARGDTLGPLHGVPLAHKDMFYRVGVVSTCGSKIRADFRPSVTATVLERLEAAGALNLGGLNMAEFATGPTGHNVHYGACRNPWNPEHITGGSSSGSGSAVAGRAVFGALGSDTGGSIRLPAAACGLFGMKGTQTRVSRYGTMGLSFSLDNIGPPARTARDCARLFGVIAGRDDRDATSARYPTADYEAATIDADVRGLRIGIPNEYFDVNDAVRTRLDASLAVFESLGARCVPVDIPFADDFGGLGGAISGVEALALHRTWLRERLQDYGPQTRARYLSNVAVSADDYMASIHARGGIIATFVERVFGQCDVLHCPIMPFEVPTVAATDLGDGQGFEQLLASITCNTRPINYLGLPALTVPVGFTENGLPAACQLIGRPFAEARLFAAGAAYEAATDWTTRTPSCV